MMNKQRLTTLLPTLVILIGSIVLLFTRLGHYCLWDDEAITAMTARAVLHTGDTSVRVDEHNMLVYRNGLLVRNFKDRYTPPLQFYFIAPFIALLGDGNFACRLPFALCGLVTVALLLLWLRRVNPPPLVWWSAAVILLTNASFFLFFRQCRYYGLTMMLTTAVAFLYCNRDGKTRWFVGLSLSLAALLAAQYLNYAIVAACLVVDYLVFGRRPSISLRGWLIILLPQLIVGVALLSIWNLSIFHPEVTSTTASISQRIHDRCCLLWFNWRDLFLCDFGILLLILGCPLLYVKHRSIWLLRAPMALFVFVTTLAFAVPTSMAQAHSAEVRYLAPAIPLCIAVAIVAVWGLTYFHPAVKWTALVLAMITLLNENTSEADYATKQKQPVPFFYHSTALLYYHELMVPQTESYTPVIEWINTNVPAGASIYIQPMYKNYPLMMRASKAVYAWQLDDTQEIFTPVNPAKAESPTLDLLNESGNLMAEVSVVNGDNPTPQSVVAALVAAWNENPQASLVATAKGENKLILLLNRGAVPLVKAAVRNIKTGSLIETTVNPRPDFGNLPDIQFFGRVAPDFMIRFGSNGESGDFPVALQMLSTRDISYQLVQTIHLHWKDYYRPERIWRTFITRDPDDGDEINIYQKIPAD